MEEEKKKSKLKIVIPVAIVVIVVVGIVVLGTLGKLKEKDVIGTWTSAENNEYYWITFELYAGGTGKAYTLKNSRQSNIGISWEIKDNILNIKTNDTTTGYKVEKNKITSVDGERIYHK